VVQGDPMDRSGSQAAVWLDGTWITFIALLAAFPFLYRATRDLDYRHNAPVIVPEAFRWIWMRLRDANTRLRWGQWNCCSGAGTDSAGCGAAARFRLMLRRI